MSSRPGLPLQAFADGRHVAEDHRGDLVVERADLAIEVVGGGDGDGVSVAPEQGFALGGCRSAGIDEPGEDFVHFGEMAGHHAGTLFVRRTAKQ